MSVQSSNQFGVHTIRGKGSDAKIILVGNACVFESISWEYVTICEVHDCRTVGRTHFRVETAEKIAEALLAACAEIRAQMEAEQREREAKTREGK